MMKEDSATGNVSVPLCKKCHYGEQHPWHDNGTPNWVDAWLWEKVKAEGKVQR